MLRIFKFSRSAGRGSNCSLVFTKCLGLGLVTMSSTWTIKSWSARLVNEQIKTYF